MSGISDADNAYEEQNDKLPSDAPAGDAGDNDYTSRVGQKTMENIPVQKDEDTVEDPIDPATADSDETLGTLTQLHTFSPYHSARMTAGDVHVAPRGAIYY